MSKIECPWCSSTDIWIDDIGQIGGPVDGYEIYGAQCNNTECQEAFYVKYKLVFDQVRMPGNV